MKQTIVVFGSTTGTCENVAQTIAQKLGCEAIPVSDFSADTIAQYDNLILGSSTWGAGDLQDDWYDGVEVLRNAALADKTVALFGVGDSESYPDTFCGALGEIYDAVADRAKVVGAVDVAGYTFEDSAAVREGSFVGLALDEVNESDKTEERIDAWIEQIKPSL